MSRCNLDAAGCLNTQTALFIKFRMHQMSLINNRDIGLSPIKKWLKLLTQAQKFKKISVNIM
jgi:hypothetical protein